MEGSYFPEDKDLAHKIMMELSNSDLVKVCATNKRMYEICNNYPSFWRNKLIKDYGEHAVEYKPDNRSWKTHYMRVFIDLQKYKADPAKFLYNIFWKNDIDDSYFIDYDNQKFTLLKEAPEWVMNNLLLLNIDEITTYGEEDAKMIKYKNIRPIEIFQKYPRLHLSKYPYIRFVKLLPPHNAWMGRSDKLLRIYYDSALPGPRPSDGW